MNKQYRYNVDSNSKTLKIKVEQIKYKCNRLKKIYTLKQTIIKEGVLIGK